MASSSSSEEDEEERKKLAEVAGIATKDIRQALSVNSHKLKSFSQKSLRAAKHDNQDVDSQLTPEFRKHVAKKLSSYIESCIQEENSSSPQNKKNKKETGIHLFHLSKERITDLEEHGLPKIPQKTQKFKNERRLESDSSDDKDALAMFKEAAVSAQSIIDCGLLGNTAKTIEDDKQNNIAETEEKTDESYHKHKKKKKKKRKELNKEMDEEGHSKTKKHKKSSISL